MTRPDPRQSETLPLLEPPQVRELLDGLHEGVVLFDADGFIRYLNAAAVRLSGFDHEQLRELQGLHMQRYFDRSTLQCLDTHNSLVFDGYLSRLLHGEAFQGIDVCVREERGDPKWIARVKGYRVSHEDQNLSMGVLALEDITEERRCLLHLHHHLKELNQEILWFYRKLTNKLKQLNPNATTEASQPEFTKRELQILQRMAAGQTNREIAAALHLTVQTIRNHAYRIYKKLGVGSRSEAVVWAREHGHGDE